MRLKRDFYKKKTLYVAKNILGKIICRKFKNRIIKGRIVEVEAYIGPYDFASHVKFKEQSKKEKLKILEEFYPKIKDYVEDWNVFKNRILKLKGTLTKRNIAEYLRGGHIYIYLVYGNYWQLNITTYKEGFPECVLLRALEPLTNDKPYPDGPGKLCEFLKLDSSFLFEDLVNSDRIWLENGFLKKGERIVKSYRIGIDYAGFDKFLPWRFYIHRG
jgi:DNA-3-methyladenine glycosylase